MAKGFWMQTVKAVDLAVTEKKAICQSDLSKRFVIALRSEYLYSRTRVYFYVYFKPF